MLAYQINESWAFNKAVNSILLSQNLATIMPICESTKKVVKMETHQEKWIAIMREALPASW